MTRYTSTRVMFRIKKSCFIDLTYLTRPQILFCMIFVIFNFDTC